MLKIFSILKKKKKKKIKKWSLHTNLLGFFIIFFSFSLENNINYKI